MDARTAEDHFKRADSLYRSGDYDEALNYLIDLDCAFPNTPNIMFPLARCLRRVGRIDESLSLCDDLVTRCGDHRALQLREFILNSQSESDEPPPLPAIPNLRGMEQSVHGGVLDDLLDSPPPPVPSYGSAAKSYTKPALIGGGVLLAALLLAIPLLFFPRAPGGESGGSSAAPAPAGADRYVLPAEADPGTQRINDMMGLNSVGVAIVFGLVQVSFFTAALYLTLRVGGKLPYETLVDNLINTVFMSLVVIVLSSVVPCLGFIASIVILYKVYELSVVEFFILFAFNVAVSLFVGGLLFAGLLGYSMLAA